MSLVHECTVETQIVTLVSRMDFSRFKTVINQENMEAKMNAWPVVTCLVTRYGVWIGKLIYWTPITRKYK
jgi:hypothetical protein